MYTAICMEITFKLLNELFLQRLHWLQETLHLTVSIIDRFVASCCRRVKQSELSLIGITSMYVAVKYEEVYKVPIGKKLFFIC